MGTLLPFVTDREELLLLFKPTLETRTEILGLNTTTNEITFPSHISIPDNFSIYQSQSQVDSTLNSESFTTTYRQPLGFIYFNDPTNTPIGGMEHGRAYWMWKTGPNTIRIKSQKLNSTSYDVNLTSAGSSGGLKRERFVFCWSSKRTFPISL